MTATRTDPPPTTRPPTDRPPRRRWHRVAAPFGLALALLGTTLVTHAVDQPDPTDRGFLSPVATGDDGGSRLAEALRARGVPVRRETDTLRAVLATRSGPATLFVPAPDLVHPDTLIALGQLGVGHRLVLVDPSRRVLAGVELPLVPTDRRWATRAVPPDADGRPCPLPEAARAGTAAADQQRYAVPADRYATPANRSATADRCYAGGLLRLAGPTEVVVIGASDPFRNDRIGEWGNRELATGLLGGHGTVVWLDLDGPAPPPRFGTGPSGEPGWSPTPGGSTEWDGDGDGRGDPDGGQSASAAPTPGGRAGQPDRADRPTRHNPLWSAFPPWFWALLAQLALAGLLVVLWRARRLGPPVPEPLPVTVRSAETVLGRARLYRRAGDPGAAARTLRAAARTRLLLRLNLPPDAPEEQVAGLLAVHAGTDPGTLRDLLYGRDPETDTELLELARALDRLTRAVDGEPGAPGHPPVAPDATGRPTEGDHR